MNNYHNKTVFITGGGGCVGRAVVRRFLANNWNVTNLAHPEEIATLPFGIDENVQIVQGELNSLLPDQIPENAFVVHLAGKVHTIPKSKDDVDDFFRVNRDGTVNLAKCALQRDTLGFLFVSTSAVYGDKLMQGICTEETEPLPNSVYGQSKFEAEQQLQSLWPTSCPLIILRPSVMFGPGDRGNFLKLFKMSKRGFVPVVYGGKTQKNILYVQDIANIIEFAASQPDLFYERIYNVAYSKPYSFRELIFDISKVTSRRVIPLPIPKAMLLPPAFFCDLIGTLCRCELPISKRKLRILGQNVVMSTNRLKKVIEQHILLHSFEEGLKDYIGTGTSLWDYKGRG